MRLQEFEVCPHLEICPFNDKYSDKYKCLGARPERQAKFECSLVTDTGEFRSLIQPKTN